LECAREGDVATEEERKKYTKEISKYDRGDTIYTDKSCINEYMYREQGRALRGRKMRSEWQEI
jgi:hypothetical protein